MDLIFYKQAATPNRVDKSAYLSTVGTISNVTLKSDVDLMRPTFILKTSPLVYNSNYVFNSFTGRYYYIETITALSGGRIAIQCKIDVLHTYRNEIKNSSGWVVRSAATTDTADDYKMLHNDYPFRSDFDILGCDLSNQTRNPFFHWPGLISLGRNILMIIK